MSTVDQLERASEIADARLGVAEKLGWPLAMFAAAAANLAWDNWLVTVGALAVCYIGVTASYRRASKQAEDAYFRAAGLGPYARNGGPAAPATDPE